MPNRLREMSGGILFTLEGKAPLCPEGYERLPGDVVMFGKILPECDARKEDWVKKCCGGKTIIRTFCEERDTFVSRQVCLDCGGMKER
jgi:hypothetical protein